MRQNKRNRLERKGWRVGTVDEFLELGPAESAYVELRVDLGEALRARRLELGMTQVQLADQLGSSQSRVAKAEAGDPSVSLDLQIRALLETGLSRDSLAEIFSSGAKRLQHPVPELERVVEGPGR